MPTPIEEKHDFLVQQGFNPGEPVGGEETFDDGGSRQVYEFARIYFHPRVGAASECHGLILERYIELGEQQSRLGYPVTDEEGSPVFAGGRMSRFEDGVVLFDPIFGAREHFVFPQVVVKIHDAIPVNLGQSEALDLGELAAIAAPFGVAPAIAATAEILPNVVLTRLFDLVSPAELASLVAGATFDDPTYSPPIFENFLSITCPLAFDTAPLVAALQTAPGLVEYAYATIPTEPAGVVATTNPRFIEQEYLFPGPVGIGVERAWAKGADGTGCRLIDIEHAWVLNPPHEDLPANIPLLTGTNGTTARGHGAAVLGVIAAVDNNLGVVGIAPKANIRLVSVIERDPNLPVSMERVASVIAFAAANLSRGDVMLLEIQADGLPVELDKGVCEVIELATRAGVIVVEAAGNKASNLDLVTDNGLNVLSRLSPDFRESGAILVGSCSSNLPHSPSPVDSNFGSRVDCYGWGESVLTTGSRVDPVFPNDYFRFSGTSAAAAIIAGVCLVMQHLQPIMIGPGAFRLTPGRMRQILSNPLNGTPSATPFDGIGSMPDFTKILANEFL